MNKSIYLIEATCSMIKIIKQLKLRKIIRRKTLQVTSFLSGIIKSVSRFGGYYREIIRAPIFMERHSWQFFFIVEIFFLFITLIFYYLSSLFLLYTITFSMDRRLKAIKVGHVGSLVVREPTE